MKQLVCTLTFFSIIWVAGTVFAFGLSDIQKTVGKNVPSSSAAATSITKSDILRATNKYNHPKHGRTRSALDTYASNFDKDFKVTAHKTAEKDREWLLKASDGCYWYKVHASKGSIKLEISGTKTACDNPSFSHLTPQVPVLP